MVGAIVAAYLISLGDPFVAFQISFVIIAAISAAGLTFSRELETNAQAVTKDRVILAYE